MSVRDYLTDNPYAAAQAVQGGVGVAGMIMNISDTVQDARESEFDIPTLMDNNPYERPQYNLGQSFAKQSAFDPENAGKGLVGQSVMSGIGAGASIGSAFPGMGTAIGAAAGAVTGLVGGLVGRGKARREARDAKERQRIKLESAQLKFNDVSAGYDASLDSRERYEKRLESRRRRINRVIG